MHAPPGEVVRPLIGYIVAVNAREHDVAQSPVRHGLSHLGGLVGVKRRRCAARLDGTEAATNKTSEEGINIRQPKRSSAAFNLGASRGVSLLGLSAAYRVGSS